MSSANRNRRGSALAFTLSIVALLAAVGAMLSGPSSAETKRVELHYRKVQAEYLSLAGVEQAKAWADRGVLTNELYLLANGTVDTTMELLTGRTCRVISVGRVRAEWRQKPIEARAEAMIQLP